MAKAAMGANVMFCGHNGWFIADIFEIDGVNVVVANGMVRYSTLVTKEPDMATHHISDFPRIGCWKPDRGFFVVPKNQVTVIKKKKGA